MQKYNGRHGKKIADIQTRAETIHDIMLENRQLLHENKRLVEKDMRNDKFRQIIASIIIVVLIAFAAVVFIIRPDYFPQLGFASVFGGLVTICANYLFKNIDHS